MSSEDTKEAFLKKKVNLEENPWEQQEPRSDKYKLSKNLIDIPSLTMSLKKRLNPSKTSIRMNVLQELWNGHGTVLLLTTTTSLSELSEPNTGLKFNFYLCSST